jgi:hypothetical protein
MKKKENLILSKHEWCDSLYSAKTIDPSSIEHLKTSNRDSLIDLKPIQKTLTTDKLKK